MSRLSFRTKILAIQALNLAFTGVLVAVAFLGLSRLDQSFKDQSKSAGLLRSEMALEMAQDALRSDVLSALQVIRSNEIKVRSELAERFHEHADRFRKQLEAIGDGPLENDVAAQLAQTRRDGEVYLSGAEDVIRVASRNRATAEKKIPTFDEKFALLENSLDKLANSLEGKLETAELRGRSNAAIAHDDLFAVSLIGTLVVILISALIARKTNRNLGDELIKMDGAARSVSDKGYARHTDPAGFDQVNAVVTAKNLFDADVTGRISVDAKNIVGESAELFNHSEYHAINRENSAADLEWLAPTVGHNADNDSLIAPLATSLSMKAPPRTQTSSTDRSRR